MDSLHYVFLYTFEDDSDRQRLYHSESIYKISFQYVFSTLCGNCEVQSVYHIACINRASLQYEYYHDDDYRNVQRLYNITYIYKFSLQYHSLYAFEDDWDVKKGHTNHSRICVTSATDWGENFKRRPPGTWCGTFAQNKILSCGSLGNLSVVSFSTSLSYSRDVLHSLDWDFITLPLGK